MAKWYLIMTFFVLLAVVAHFDNPMDVGAPLMNSGGFTMTVEGIKDLPIASINKGKFRRSRPFNKLMTRTMRDEYVPLCHEDQLCTGIGSDPHLLCDDECKCDEDMGYCYALFCHFNIHCDGINWLCGDPECACNEAKGFCNTIPDTVPDTE